jgi:hypothetical protein
MEIIARKNAKNKVAKAQTARAIAGITNNGTVLLFNIFVCLAPGRLCALIFSVSEARVSTL